MAGKSRGVFEMIFKHFINSLKPRKFSGTLKGEDYLGNKYYEQEPSSISQTKRSSRYFEPAVKDDFQQDLPAEWEAWLRFRRKEPPSEDEIVKNQAIMYLKKENAAKLDAERAAAMPPKEKFIEAEKTGVQSFPTYEEYEDIPGAPKNRQKWTALKTRKNE